MDLERADKLARHYMKLYGLFDQHWSFGFNNRKRSLGVCKYARRGQPGGRIELNEHWTSTAAEADVIDTIKHECAHALVGPGHGHDDVWKAMCRKLGCTPSARADESVSGEMDKTGAVVEGECGNCEQKFHLFRRPKRMTGHFCRKCGPADGKFDWKPVTPAGTVVKQPTSLKEMGLDANEIKALTSFARGFGSQWKEKIIALWGGERGALLSFYADVNVILGLDEKIRAYLSIIHFKQQVLD